MRIYLLSIAIILALLLGLFAVAQALELPLLRDPRPWLGAGGWAGAATGVGLLIADVLIPVPSSLIMIAHGAVFGVALGASLSLIGSLGAGWLGFAIGRRGGPLFDRWLGEGERARVDRWLERWGGLGIVVSRPIPLLAEAVAIVAGASAIGWTEMTFATALGALPASLLYALAGAATARLGHPGLAFMAVLLVAAPSWLLMRRARRAATAERFRTREGEGR